MLLPYPPHVGFGAGVAGHHADRLAVAAIAHRLVLEQQARFSGVTARNVVEEVLKKIPVPT